MKRYLGIEISIDDDLIKNAGVLINAISNSTIFKSWTCEKKVQLVGDYVSIEVLEYEHDDYFEIDNFYELLDSLENVISSFKSSDKDFLNLRISCEYDEQCNLEFTVSELDKMSKRNISLCISCWES